MGVIARITGSALVIAQVSSGVAVAHQCTCRANGQAYSQGRIMCIRGQLARCEMNENVPTWKIISSSCPEARMSPVPVRVAAKEPARRR